MLVCHKQGFQFKGKTYDRGDRIIDPALEAEIDANPHVMQFFSRRANPPTADQPAWAPLVAAPGADT